MISTSRRFRLDDDHPETAQHRGPSPDIAAWHYRLRELLLAAFQYYKQVAIQDCTFGALASGRESGDVGTAPGDLPVDPLTWHLHRKRGGAMIGREKRVLLRHYLEQEMNKAAIARDLGISRRTVYHWIETGQLDRELDEESVGYGPRCLMPSKLDPYKPLIDTRLREYPKLTAVRLFKEVRAAGPGGLRLLPATLGQALRTNRRAGLLEAAVGSVLRAADHEGPDAWPGVFVFLLRRRSLRASVRPDEGGRHRGRSRR